MKITLKTAVLVALMAFYVLIILSNFSSFEGFTASDSSSLSHNLLASSSDVSTAVKTGPKSTTSPKA